MFENKSKVYDLKFNGPSNVLYSPVIIVPIIFTGKLEKAMKEKSSTMQRIVRARRQFPRPSPPSLGRQPNLSEK